MNATVKNDKTILTLNIIIKCVLYKKSFKNILENMFVLYKKSYAIILDH